MTKKLVKGRGSNPNSHGNNIKLSSERAIAKEVTLYEHHWKISNELGQGNNSKGLRLMADIAISAGSENVDKLFSTLPVMSKAKLSIETLLNLLEQFQLDTEQSKIVEYAESVLYDLEYLEIENAYTEAEITGIVQKDKQENKGAFII